MPLTDTEPRIVNLALIRDRDRRARCSGVVRAVEIAREEVAALAATEKTEREG